MPVNHILLCTINLFTTSLPQERPPARQLPRRNFSKIHHKKPFREKIPNRIM
jgi:hypothetical protein